MRNGFRNYLPETGWNVKKINKMSDRYIFLHDTTVALMKFVIQFFLFSSISNFSVLSIFLLCFLVPYSIFLSVVYVQYELPARYLNPFTRTQLFSVLYSHILLRYVSILYFFFSYLLKVFFVELLGTYHFHIEKVYLMFPMDYTSFSQAICPVFS